MSDELRVKYLFVNMKLANYVTLSIVTVILTAIAASVTYALFHDHPMFLISKIWIVLAAAIPLQIFEAVMAVRRARRRASKP